MKLAVVAVGRRVPSWVEAGCAEYLRRFDRGVQVGVTAVPEVRRSAAVGHARARALESERLRSAMPAGARMVLLDVSGECVTSETLAVRLRELAGGAPAACLIGGADGVDESLARSASWRWSLSALTLPHHLVRVVVLEQLYRAYTLWRGLPYHSAH